MEKIPVQHSFSQLNPEDNMDKIKLILVDDHEIFIAGLRLKLASYSDSMELIAEASDSQGLMFHLSNGLLPDIILMDYNLPDLDGISIAKHLKNHEKYKTIKIIILSAYSSHFLNAHNYDLIREAIDTGIEGYLLKDSKIDEITLAISNVINGETFVLGNTINIQAINREIIEDRQRLMNYLKKQNNFSLTKREVEILQLFTQGHSAKTIANLLIISEEAVTNHKDNIKLKLKEKYGLDFKNVVELVVWAIKNKVVKV
jgi:DNA-binding NarL/FixJ family response regulator